MYNNKVLDHFLDPRNIGEIKNADGIGFVGDPSCGDSLKVFIKVKYNRLQEVKYKIMGCPAAIATSSVMSELAVGKTLEEGLNLTDEDILKELVELPEPKVHCSNLGAKALHNAINDYIHKKE